MKTSHLSIIVISIVAFSSSLAYAEQPLLDFYNNSQLVLVGKVISLSQVPTTSNPAQSPNQTRYDIQVEQYYKNPQTAKLITVYGYAKGIYFSQDPTYDVGDRVFLYLNQENGYYQIQPHSFVLNNDCDARTMIPMPTLPFEPPPISTPAAMGDIFNFESDTGNSGYFFRVGDKIHINFVAENYMPLVKDATLNFTIKAENDTKTISNYTKHVTIPPCNGRVPVSWDFTPKNPGTYLVYVNMSDSVSLGNQIVLFNDPSLGSSFTVRENMAGGAIDKSPYLPSPLMQFKSGTEAKDVQCKEGFQFIMKKENGQYACVSKETANLLFNRGWGILPLGGLPTSQHGNIEPQDAVPLKNQTSSNPILLLSVGSGYMNPAETLIVDISLNNTSAKTLTLAKSDNWPRDDLRSGLCSNLPLGISILKGNYDEKNMTGISSLVIYQSVPCPRPSEIRSYTFQPLSTNAIQECDSLFSCTGSVDMKAHLEITGFIDNSNQHKPFGIGTYTIVAGDEWGDTTIQHFTEEYATAYSDPIGK